MQSLQKAKINLLFDHPFFATILLKMETIISDRFPTAATNGKELFINPDFFENLDEDEQIGLLAHEVLHPAFLHHTRRGNRDPKLWNMACDYVINPILRDGKFKLPVGALYKHQYAGMSAEDVYDLLESKAEKQSSKQWGDGQDGDDGQDKQQGSGGDGQSDAESGDGGQWQPGDGFAGGMGDVMDLPEIAEGETSEVKAHEVDMVQTVEQAYAIAKKAGKGHGAIEVYLEDVKEAKVPWADYLRQLLSEKSYDDYTWRQPNRRYLQHRFYLPSMESERYEEMVVVIDTSCSVDEEELKMYAGEINDIHSFIHNRVTVIHCDTKISKVETFEADEEIVMTAKGRGGTDFKAPFAYVEEEDLDPKLLVYFTDGYCSSFPEEPEYDTYWCITVPEKRRKFKPPFGEVIYIN